MTQKFAKRPTYWPARIPADTGNAKNSNSEIANRNIKRAPVSSSVSIARLLTVVTVQNVRYQRPLNANLSGNYSKRLTVGVHCANLIAVNNDTFAPEHLSFPLRSSQASNNTFR
jgi:hypothetical protein